MQGVLVDVLENCIIWCVNMYRYCYRLKIVCLTAHEGIKIDTTAGLVRTDFVPFSLQQLFMLKVK